MGFRDIVRRVSIVGPEETSGPAYVSPMVPVPRGATPEERAELMRRLLRQARDEHGFTRVTDRRIERLLTRADRRRSHGR